MIDKDYTKHWWINIDKWIFFLTLFLIFIGFFLILSSSSSYENRYDLKDGYLIKKHLLFVPISIFIILFFSFISVKDLIKFSIVIFVFALILTFIPIALNTEIQGAKRWIKIYFISLQPSELLKPSFAVLSALLLARFHKKKDYSLLTNFFIFFLISFSLILQPDFGMLVLLFMMWLTQILISGLSLKVIFSILLCGFCTFVFAYFKYEHISFRINNYLNSDIGDNYQVKKSLEAISNGGLFGTGIGSGKISEKLPDAHSDFIFALAGEELGLIFLILIMLIYMLIFYRVIMSILREKNLFVFISCSGLIIVFINQCIINICSTLNLIPTKGMTLPFLSYGGSSYISCALIIGSLLCLTKKST